MSGRRLLQRPKGTFPFKRLSSLYINRIADNVELPAPYAKFLGRKSLQRAAFNFDKLCNEVQALEDWGEEGWEEGGLDGLVDQAKVAAMDLVLGCSAMVGTIWARNPVAVKKAEFPKIPAGVPAGITCSYEQAPMMGPMGGDTDAYERWIWAAQWVAAGRMNAQFPDTDDFPSDKFLAKMLQIQEQVVDGKELAYLGREMGVDVQSPEGRAFVLKHSPWLLCLGVAQQARYLTYEGPEHGSGGREGVLEAVEYYDKTGAIALTVVDTVSGSASLQAYLAEQWEENIEVEYR